MMPLPESIAIADTSRVDEAPLPATLAFVFAVGTSILIGWIAMFLLLRARW